MALLSLRASDSNSSKLAPFRARELKSRSSASPRFSSEDIKKRSTISCRCEIESLINRGEAVILLICDDEGRACFKVKLMCYIKKI